MADADAAKLQGRWTVTAEDDGEFEVRFNSVGRIDRVSTMIGNATTTFTITGTTTYVEEDEVMITIPSIVGTINFEGTLSGDGNTIEGMLERNLTFGGTSVQIPAGALILKRVSDEDGASDNASDNSDNNGDDQGAPS